MADRGEDRPKGGARAGDGRPRVMHLVSRLKHGGISSQLVNLLRHWDHDKIHHVVCSLSEPDQYADEVRRAGARLIVVGHTPGRSLLATTMALRRHIRRINPIVLHMNMRFDQHVGSLASLGIPVFKIGTMHGVASGSSGGLGQYLLDALITHRTVDQFFSVSHATKEDWVTHGRLHPSRIQVIHNGIEFDKWSRPPPHRELTTLRDQLSLHSTPTIILAVGRLARQKGFDRLVPFMKHLLRRHPQTSLLIAGEGKERGALEHLIADAGLEEHIRLLGARNDVHSLLHLADLFVFPSRSETFGLALAEAMATGTPVLASDLPCLREVVGELEDDVLFSHEDMKAVVEMADRLLSNPARRKELGAQLQQRAQRFDIAVTARRLEKVYVSQKP